MTRLLRNVASVAFMITALVIFSARIDANPFSGYCSANASQCFDYNNQFWGCTQSCDTVAADCTAWCGGAPQSYSCDHLSPASGVCNCGCPG